MTVALAAVAAALLVPAIATPAAAAEDSCATTGAEGWLKFSWSGKYRIDPLKLMVEDQLGDGHHVAVRLVTNRADGTIHHWGWHHNYEGVDIMQVWNTYASDSAGITKAEIQVARMEGSTIMNLCNSGKIANPNW
ncbi:hypothetical protein OHT76_21890 [Streptomyces sp. NBC_00287]|uniref:hypothetical protein n=1 Tax=Streptomyces sp. NBC_00287 TaxID=2975702 RepID=UPI002E2D2CEE|nr:hypothetical protein [Streptomyces sp. NBC_00287]